MKVVAFPAKIVDGASVTKILGKDYEWALCPLMNRYEAIIEAIPIEC